VVGEQARRERRDREGQRKQGSAGLVSIVPSRDEAGERARGAAAGYFDDIVVVEAGTHDGRE